MSEVDTLSGDNSTVYTTTTEEIRRDYIDACTQTYDSSWEENEEQFDRWLAEVKAQAFAQGRDSQRDYAEHKERERIIALIEREWESEAMATNAGCEWLIALIKGEEQ